MVLCGILLLDKKLRGNIMEASDLERIGNKFTTDGEDIWELKSTCMQPSCVMENLKTNETKAFGMGGLTAEKFHFIPMPEKSRE